MAFEDIVNKDKGKDSFKLPNPLASSKVKATTSWQKDTIDYYINNITDNDNYRKSKDEMIKNKNLLGGIVDPDEMRKALDPLELDGSYDDSFYTQFYNIISPALDSLYGEELKRQNDIRAVAINPEVINQKDIIFQEKLLQFLQEESSKSQLNEETLKNQLEEFDKWKKYDLQTAHEVMANQLINVFVSDNEMNLKGTFNDGFENLTTIAEVVYRIGNIGIDPTVNLVDSTNFYVLGLGKSKRIEEAHCWLEIQHLSPYKIIEEFAEDLTKTQVSRILNGDNILNNGMTQRPTFISRNFSDPKNINGSGIEDALFKDQTVLELDGITTGTLVDGNGNCRVIRLHFISPRKIGKLKYYDPETGDEEYKFVDENYIINENLGEEINWLYVNEIWQAVRILDDIDLRVKPCDVQMRSLVNPYIVRPPYVGIVFTDGETKAKSIVDKIYNYQVDFNIWMLKLKHLWTTNLGKVGVIDVSRIPANMNPKDWMYWLKTFKLAYENPFEEHQKYKGTLAGNMQQNHRVLDLSLATEIQQAIQMLDWLKQQVDIATAVPKPRQGQMSGNEGLGTSQQAIMQSSNQTERLFYYHDLVKVRVLNYLLEYTKILWKDQSIRRQYALDDLSNHLIEIDGELINEAEFGIFITNGSKLYEMNQMMQQLAHAAMQTGTANLSDIAEMQMATSPSESLANLKAAEERRNKQLLEADKAKQEYQTQLMDKQEQMAQTAHEREKELIILKGDIDYKIKMAVEGLKIDANDKMNMDNLDSTEELNGNTNTDSQTEKVKLDHDAKMKTLENDKMKHSNEMTFKEKELATKKEIEMAKLRNSNKSKQ